MIQIASYMPRLAPLPIPMAEHLLKQQRRLLQKTVRTSSPDELEKGALSLLEQNIQVKRQAVYGLMDPLVQTEKGSREVPLSTTWIMQVLRAHTPENRLVPSQTLSLWRERHLLRYRERGHPDLDNTAALLLARTQPPYCLLGWLMSACAIGFPPRLRRMSQPGGAGDRIRLQCHGCPVQFHCPVIFLPRRSSGHPG